VIDIEGVALLPVMAVPFGSEGAVPNGSRGGSTRDRDRPHFPLSRAPCHDGAMNTNPLNLDDVLKSFDQKWSPRIVTQVNNYDVRVAKVQGTYIWHQHDNTDEFFMVLDGQLQIGLRDGADHGERVVNLGPNDVFTVPCGVEHRPASADGASILMFEMSGTLTTGTTDEAIPDYVDSTTGHGIE
jgi:mannose-6-phosphate isomerase-like protein (cupin superfamily)